MSEVVLAAHAARGFEFVGIVVMVLGSIVAVGMGATRRDYNAIRRYVARSILLGLEFLIAADIIATITVQPTLSNVVALGLIVLIRTFLSFTLEYESTGRRPWRHNGALERHPAQAPTSEPL